MEISLMLTSIPSVLTLGEALYRHERSFIKELYGGLEMGRGLILIWDQRWLPGLSYGKVMSPRIDASINKVSDLFQQNSKVWNLDLIETLFYPWEATMINSIIVSEVDDIDIHVWPLTLDGEYSVRTTYRSQENVAPQAQPSSFSIENAATVWKGVWKIHAPSKIRHFLWRALRDSLPTKPNLRLRHVMGMKLALYVRKGRKQPYTTCEQA
ncbi:hypothetical protein SO802_015525 [Lithocarpus litseifolius]|uniref:Reverse transcriptase zinc-binding domain-containing protein n=1 Tax=Lithocarpus litseifolius TaxID=425828 RepID=A0AAW2CV77_9ROSI